MPKNDGFKSQIEKVKMVAKIPPQKTTPKSTISYKTVRNVSLQTWAVPTVTGTVKLSPGDTVRIPAHAISNRLINLQKRRLVTIS